MPRCRCTGTSHAHPESRFPLEDSAKATHSHQSQLQRREPSEETTTAAPSCYAGFNRKLDTSAGGYALWTLSNVIRLVIVLAVAGTSDAFHCHAKCTCIWRNGKQSADCQELKLSKVPNDLDSGVQVLDLKRNSFSYLPRHTFVDAGLVNLQRLYLAECGLDQIDELAFFRLSNLIELDLSDNRLSHVPSTAFRQVPSLRHLNLKRNSLTFLGHQAFSDLKYLIFLEVSGNRIDSVAVGSFEGLEKLEVLKIADNRLETMNGKAFLPLKALNAMTLDGNPWRCDCDLRALPQWFDSHNVPYVSPTCEKPLQVKGRQWKSLALEEFACPPSFLNSTSAFHVLDGTNVTMECRSTGDPLPTVQWFWRDRVLGNMSEGISPRQIFTVSEKGEREKISALTVTSIQEPNAGTYSCRAENVAAKVVKNFTVHVTRRPVTTPVKNAGSEARGTSRGEATGQGSSVQEEKTQEVREQEAGGVSGSEEESKSDPLVGLIVGVVVGALLVLLAFAVVLLVCRRKRRERRKRAENSSAGGPLHKLAPQDKGHSPDGHLDEADTKLLSPRPASVSLLPPAYLHHHELEPLEPLMEQRNSLSPHVWVVKDHVPPEWPPRRSPIPVAMPVAPNSGDPEMHARLHSELADTLRRKTVDRRGPERERGDGSSEMEANDLGPNDPENKMAAPFETLRVRELQDRANGDEPDLLMLDSRPKRVQPLPSILDHHNPQYHTLGRRGSPASLMGVNGGHLTPQPRGGEWETYDHPSAYFRPVQHTGQPQQPIHHHQQVVAPMSLVSKELDDGGGSDGTEV